MIRFTKYILENGLRVIHHEDNSTPMVAINIAYNVGSKDDDAHRTGFAHLFEHLMFGGSVNVPSYDEPLQKAGGENNAWTSSDLTNYYLTLPAVNVETGFWLESDRMLGLAFSEQSLDVQRKVVVEEFKQRYLNQPYGDSGLLIYPRAYKKHPYKWPTIGKELSHIEDAALYEVKAFYEKHYAPNNAVLVVSGNITLEKTRYFVDKWFAPIPARQIAVRNLAVEPPQTMAEFISVERDVPQNAIYKTWHMGGRAEKSYLVADLVSDVLSNGSSSRLYQRLVKDNPIFSDVNAYISGSIDPGLMFLSGKLLPSISFAQAEDAIEIELAQMRNTPVSVKELDKVRNKLEANFVYGNMSYLNKAMNLAYFEILGDANEINTEMDKYLSVTPDEMLAESNQIFRNENCTTLHYQSLNSKV